MKKQFWMETGALFLSIFSACLLNLAVMPLILRIIDLFVEVEYFAQMLIRIVISVAVVGGIPAAVCYFVSYRKAEFELPRACGTFSLVTLFQLLFSILLKFYPFISGGVLYLAGIFEHGTEFSSAADIEAIGFVDYLLAFVLLSVFNLVAYVICGKIGASKRLKDREKLRSESVE